MARMHRQQLDIEPALAWSMALFAGVIALMGRVWVASYLYMPDPSLQTAAKAVAALYAVLGLGLAGAMGEPLPADPREGSIPLRLRACWGVLGLCPPPSRGLRIPTAVGLAVLNAYPSHDVGLYSLLAGGVLAVTGFVLEKPRKDLTMSATEWFYLLSLSALALGAVFTSGGDDVPEAWRAVAALAGAGVLAAQRAREVAAARWAQLKPGIPPPPALDLSRYELSVERKGPAAPPVLIEGAEEQLVDTGSFRVDAAKMLEKLRNYQLTDPRDFICAWLRCAAASGAMEIRLTTSATGIALAFDGRPFSASELSQPYQALVDAEGKDAKRGRHFAYGLLGLYRLKPRSVSVTSRGSDGVAAMNAGVGKPPDPEAAPQGTVIRVDWPAWGLYWRPFLLAQRARSRYGLGPAPLFIDGKPAPNHPEGGDWRPYKKKNWRAALSPPVLNPTVRLYVLGTLIEEMESPDGNCDAWLANDELELDISQSAVVRGKTLDEGLAIVAGNFNPWAR